MESELPAVPLPPYADIPRTPPVTASDWPRAELQGHAIKNQDLLLPSGVSGQNNPDALDQDVEATVCLASPSFFFRSIHLTLSHLTQSPRQLVDQQQQQQQQQLQPDLAARDRELTEIAKSIATLAELFKDLSALVIDQGTLLDSVEYNIEQTAVHMDESVKELDMATRLVHSRVPICDSKSDLYLPIPNSSLYLFIVHPPDRYQKNTGRRKCIFLLLLIIFGLIVVLIFKPRRHSSSPAPTPISTQAPQSHRSLHS
jgi:syntaxin 16